MKDYLGIMIRKFYSQQFSSDIMANRLIGSLVCLICLCYYFSVGYFIDDFVLSIGTNFAEASFFIVSLGLWTDFILKMVLWNGYVQRLQKLEVLPVKKKYVVLARFAESLFSPYNLGLFLYILPFSVSIASEDVVSAVMLPIAMLLAGLSNAAFSNVVKTSMDCKPTKWTIGTLLPVVCSWLLVSCAYKANYEWGIWATTDYGCALSSVVMLLIAAAELYVAWRFYWSLNARYEQRGGTRFSVIVDNMSGTNYLLFLAQITRTTIRKNYLAFLTISLVLPLLVTNSENEVLIYICMIVPFILPMNEGDQTFSVESTYMDRLATLSPRLLYNVLVTKYRSCVVWEAAMLGFLLLLLPRQYMLFLIAVCLYSAGPLLLIEFGSSVFNAKRWAIMENPKVSLFGPYNVVTVAVVLFSVLVYLLMAKTVSANVASAVFICLGISGILSHTVCLDFIYDKFMQRRHLNLMKYRMLY